MLKLKRANDSWLQLIGEQILEASHRDRLERRLARDRAVLRICLFLSFAGILGVTFHEWFLGGGRALALAAMVISIVSAIGGSLFLLVKRPCPVCGQHASRAQPCIHCGLPRGYRLAREQQAPEKNLRT